MRSSTMHVSLNELPTPTGREGSLNGTAQISETGNFQELSDYVTRNRVGGRLMATLLLIPATPIIGLLAILIRLTSPGPAIFWQERVGLHGRKIRICKLRTMRID